MNVSKRILFKSSAEDLHKVSFYVKLYIVEYNMSSYYTYRHYAHTHTHTVYIETQYV